MEQRKEQLKHRGSERILDGVSDAAQLWVFSTAEPIAPSTLSRLRAALEAGLSSWHSHKTPVSWAYDIRWNRFILVGAEVQGSNPSGCSIDSLRGIVSEAMRNVNVDLEDSAGNIYFITDGEVRSCSREEFQALCEVGTVLPTTTVFDNSITDVGQLRAGSWELPFTRSWHSRAYDLKPAVQASKH